MSAGGKYLPKTNPKRPIVKHRLVVQAPPRHCPRPGCDVELEDGKYHDCGDQLRLDL